MSRLLLTVVFSLFLLFQTTSIADDSNETYIEDQAPQAEEKKEVQEKEALSEAELEARQAEEDEIRESEAAEKAEED
jgi:hypothetical protein